MADEPTGETDCEYCDGEGCAECDPDDLLGQDDSDEPRDIDGSPLEFADPGGESALRAASDSNPRDLPCPTCGRENMLTRKDKMLGYQCDRCANRQEQGFDF